MTVAIVAKIMSGRLPWLVNRRFMVSLHRSTIYVLKSAGDCCVLFTPIQPLVLPLLHAGQPFKDVYPFSGLSQRSCSQSAQIQC